jgi:hypothetical protein
MSPDRGKTCDFLREMCKLKGENTHLCMLAGKGKINIYVLEWASMCQKMGNTCQLGKRNIRSVECGNMLGIMGKYCS